MNEALRRSIGAALAVGALEIALGRLSSAPQTRADVLTTMIGWCALAAGPVWLVTRTLAEGLARRLLQALFSSVPALLVSGGVLLTPFYQDPTIEHALGALWIVGVLAVRFAASRSGPATMSAPEAAAWIGVAALLAWFVEHGTLPGFSVAGAFVALCVVGGAACTRWLHMPAVFLAAAVISFAPTLPLISSWNEGPRQAPGPDLVLFTVAGLTPESIAEGRAYDWLRENGVEWKMPAPASLSTLLSGQPASVDAGMPESKTLAERISAAGYDTAAIVASDGLMASRGYGRGYAAWQHVSERHRFALPRAPGEREARTLLPRLLNRAGWNDRPAPNGARHVARWVKELLEQRRIDRPFHLWVHWSDPVPPYLQADQAEIPFSTAIAIENGSLDPSDPAAGEALALAYANEVALVDRGLRYAIEALGPVPLRGRVLAFVSTQPAPAGAAGRLLLVDSRAPDSSGAPLMAGTGGANAVDLLPTLLEAAKLSREGLPGRSLAPPSSGPP